MLARAKINLMLHVIGRRDDGYHTLQSLVVFADMGDELVLEPSDFFSLSIEGEFAGGLQSNIGHNLVSRAAAVLSDVSNVQPHGRITLTKNLPIGAGLGGGSADAACALHLLAEYWKWGSPLHPLAEKLGSDIPACLFSTPLWMEGAGEVITLVQLDIDIPILLVNPRCEVSARDVYQRLTPPYDMPIRRPTHLTSLPGLIEFLGNTHNTLETPAIELEPAISDVLEALAELPGCMMGRMSGSGSTCFGIFPTQEACKMAQYALHRTHPHWWARATTIRRTHG